MMTIFHINLLEDDSEFDRSVVSEKLCQEVTMGMIVCHTVEEKIAARLSSFLCLGNNWDDEGDGVSFREQDLNWANDFIQNLVRSHIVKPHIYPETPNDVRLEWSGNEKNVVLTLLLKDKCADLFFYNRKTKYSRHRRLNLKNQSDMDYLRKKVLECL